MSTYLVAIEVLRFDELLIHSAVTGNALDEQEAIREIADNLAGDYENVVNASRAWAFKLEEPMSIVSIERQYETVVKEPL